MNQVKYTRDDSAACTVLRKKAKLHEREKQGPAAVGVGPRVREMPPDLRTEESFAGRAGNGISTH